MGIIFYKSERIRKEHLKNYSFDGIYFVKSNCNIENFIIKTASTRYR